MASPRRAQYVSIAMGPGVLSNTTGRGAHTRIAYMNWDRWKDSSWIRWHKLLPEKQGGWAYQALIVANQTAAAVLGTPSLLLHCDGAPASTTFIDSSVYNNAMSATAAQITATAPKFGTGAYTNPAGAPSSAAQLTTPITANGPLDMNGVDWTVEFWAKYVAGGISQFAISLQQSVSGNGFRVFYNANNGLWTYQDLTNSNVVLGPSITTNDGAWHCIALCSKAGLVTVFVDGTPGAVSAIVDVQSTGDFCYIGASANSSIQNTFWAGQLDEIRVTKGIALYTTAYTPATAANTLGLPNALGVPNPPNSLITPTYLGQARDLHDWSSIDGQYWIAIGTHLKLYVVNQSTLYDITPQRKTSNLVNPFSTTIASAVVTVTDPGHEANTGDFVDITGGSAVGGLTLAGSYQLIVADPNTYTILASAAATSTVAAGGGNVSIAYEISTGLPSNGELLGYGTGTYGALTYGTPRAVGTGVFARLRTWSLDNYGQDLIASQSDGEIYWWQKINGPNSPAAIIPLAPQGCQRVLVDAQQRVIIALGCTDITSTYDAMLVRWCSFDDITDWVPTDVNTAGDDLLTSGSRIITGLKTKGQNLIFTDTTLHTMVFVGGTDIYQITPAGEVTIVGPNAAVDVDGVPYFMGYDNFYNYSGTLNLQACEVWETVFDPNVSTSLLRSQAEKVVCYTYEPKTEITWLYPSIGGVSTLTFASGPVQGSTSGTLAAAWTGASGIYLVTFSDAEEQPVTLANGATTATWPSALLATVTASAQLGGDCDRYVTFNWEDGTWYYGAWNRTCAVGRSPALGGYPYGANAGYLYQHEIGTDAVEAAGTVAIGCYMQSLDITVGGAKSEYTMGGSDARFAVGGSDAHLLLRSLIPDWKYFTGAMNVTIFTKDRPQDATYVQSGPIAFSEGTDQIDIDAHGSQLVMQWDNYTGTNGAPSLGCSFRMGIFQGLATPYAKR